MSKAPVIPDSAPFDTAQRIWLNGFLAGLFAHEPANVDGSAGSQDPVGTAPLSVVFGSQTGTAETLARRVAAEADRRGFRSRVIDAGAATKVDWAAETQLLVVMSTYGDGDMPDNARTFWDWLQTDAAKAMAHLRFSVLALGDSNYEQFCAAGKKVDERLEALGAARLHPRTDCDVDYEAAAKSWIDGALGALGTANSQNTTEPKLQSSAGPSRIPVEGYSRANPFPARMLVNRRLTGEGSGKEVRHIELSLEGSDLEYVVGDALGVRPTNCPTLVGELLTLLRCDGEEAVPIPGGGEVSLRKALGECYDISKPSPAFLKAAAELSPALRALLESDHKEELNSWLYGREIIDLLMQEPPWTVAPEAFVAVLKPLAPRLYSISSSPKAHPGQVHLTVGIVRNEIHGRSRKGVCSTFLADRVLDSVPVPVFVQKSHGFRLPDNPDTPIIMVGPGTGVAPFRAFLHERRATAAQGRNWLFFGEQRAAADFFYREELEPMLMSGHLTKLSTAFSRDQADKIYVQHRMLEEAPTLWAWLQEGAHFYVCGDAQRMAKDVEAALLRVIETAGGRSPEDSLAYLNQMRTEKRYQRDVY